ncbi:MAG: DedA family protein [Actinomycetota bacterium]|nr:DedA family protein [Actinomycetota bacterium]
MFDWLTALVSASPLTYLVLFAAVVGDAILPVIPAEPMVIAASVLSAQGHLIVAAVLLATVLGAFAGDHVSYFLGRFFGQRAASRISRGEKGARRLEWAERTLERRGATLLVVARFIPGGRTAATLAAGTLNMPWRRFALADAVAAVLWGLYASAIGYFGGAAFSQSPWRPLAVSLGIATALALVVEGYRRIQRRRGRDVLGDRLEPGS